MEHRHLGEEETYALVLPLQYLCFSSEELLNHGLGGMRRNEFLPSGRWKELVAGVEEARSCSLCRERFERVWTQEAEVTVESPPPETYPDVPELQRTEFRQRVAESSASGKAASPEPAEGSPCEITCAGTDMLVRILAERDGTATAVLLLTSGSPEGVILRVDGDEVEFGATGVLRLPSMPVRIGVQRRLPEPGQPS